MVQHRKEQSLVFCVWRGNGTKSVPTRQDGREKEGKNEEGEGGWITHDGPVTYIFCLCLTCQGVSKSE